jgi:Protein of unknown function (DUF2934)
MKKYPTRSEETQILAAGQTHNDMHPGHGVIAEPTHDDMALRAYGIYADNGCKPGRCLQNWHQAEHELRNHLALV